MKNVMLLDEQDMDKIRQCLEQADIEVGSMYNKGVPDDLSMNMRELNYNLQKLGELLGIWDFNYENR